MAKALVALGAAAAILGIVLGVGPGLIGANFHEVVSGRIYRSAQLSPSELVERVDRHGLRSVINLRGEETERDWYRQQVELLQDEGIVFRSIDLVPERLPPRPAVAKLIDSFENLPEPILVHCRAGADRTGFASVLARIVVDGASLADARSELGLRYGHLSFGAGAEIARFFDLYEAHLQSGVKDTPATFRRWAREIYVPYVYSARIEAGSFPTEASAGERLDVRVQIANRSPGPWIFTSDLDRGIKLGVRLRDVQREREGDWLDYDRHGALEATLKPKEQMELDVSIWAPRRPGHYLVKLDMVDEHVTWFEDQGSPPLVLPLLVHAP